VCREGDNAPALRRVALSAALFALLAPATASAHGSIVPTAAVSGTVQRFVVTVPALLGGQSIVGFSLFVPNAVRVESAEANQPRWTASVSGGTITWEGGPIEGLGEDFAFRARLPETEGAVTFEGQERYRNGSGLRFPLAVTVTRAAESGAAASSDDDLAWIAIALAGTALLLALGAAIAAGALWVRLRRR
jgi:uncharacterized protein YcnI